MGVETIVDKVLLGKTVPPRIKMDLVRVSRRNLGSWSRQLKSWGFAGIPDEYLKREYLTRGMESFAAGNLNDAVQHWERALRLDPGDEKARAYLTRAQEHLLRTREIGSR